MADAASNWRWQKVIGLIPLIALPIAMLYQLSVVEYNLVFNPPYVPLILQAIFVLGTSIAVAYFSIRGYLNSGSLNLVFLGSSLLVFGLTSTVSLVPFGLSSNTVVTMANLGIFTASVLQFIGSIITVFPRFSAKNANRKAIVTTALIGSLALIVFAIASALAGVLPVFLGPTGPTPIRLSILWITIGLLFVSCLLYASRYLKTKSETLYWYSLALALFFLAILASVFTAKLGDIMNWVSRLAIYLTGVYFLLALLNRGAKRETSEGLAATWASAFRLDRVQSEKLFTNMLNGFMYCKIVTNSQNKPVDWIYLDVNKAFEHIIGVKKESVVGKSASSLSLSEPSELEESAKIYGAIALTGQPKQFELYRKIIGKWLSISAYSPERGYFVAIFEDITERKKAQQDAEIGKRRLMDAVNSVREPFYSLDRNWNFVFVNNADQMTASAKAVGLQTSQDLVGRNIWKIFPSIVGTNIEYQFREAMEKREIRQFVRSGDKYAKITVEVTVYPSVEGITIFANDITERKKAEQTIKERNEQLEQTRKKLEEKATEVEEYASQMEHLANERAKQLKDAERLATIGATAGMVGHDIRNPLQAIVGDLFLAREETKDMPEGEAKKYLIVNLDQIEANIFYINKIVGDLQDYARPLNPQAHETDMESVIQYATINSHIPENIKTDYEIAPNARNVMADPDFLKRIVGNLTLNAVQAMPDGGKLTIKASKDKVTGGTILTVQDTGVGIPDNIKDKLFTPMFTTKSKGQGFGLAVVKRMTEGLGGTISFESQVGKGTKFIVRLPPPKEINGRFSFK